MNYKKINWKIYMNTHSISDFRDEVSTHKLIYKHYIARDAYNAYLFFIVMKDDIIIDDDEIVSEYLKNSDEFKEWNINKKITILTYVKQWDEPYVENRIRSLVKKWGSKMLNDKRMKTLHLTSKELLLRHQFLKTLSPDQVAYLKDYYTRVFEARLMDLDMPPIDEGAAIFHKSKQGLEWLAYKKEYENWEESLKMKKLYD